MKIQFGPLFRNSLLMFALVALSFGASAQIFGSNAIEPHAGQAADKPMTRFLDYEVYTFLKPPLLDGFTFHSSIFTFNNQNKHNI
jgi:hypothetical protein